MKSAYCANSSHRNRGPPRVSPGMVMTAPAVFFLPGLLEDAEAFRALMDGLADVAGCGVADMTRADTIAGIARSALGQAPAGPLHLVGHSMGGYVALEILRQAPERVARVAFLHRSEERR